MPLLLPVLVFPAASSCSGGSEISFICRGLIPGSWPLPSGLPQTRIQNRRKSNDHDDHQCGYWAVRAALKMVKPDLPSGQAIHVLRHTFATHFMINGGNIITLQRILGHATIQQTMTYAHFAPDYLQDAVKFNPVAGSVHILPINRN